MQVQQCRGQTSTGARDNIGTAENPANDPAANNAVESGSTQTSPLERVNDLGMWLKQTFYSWVKNKKVEAKLKNLNTPNSFVSFPLMLGFADGLTGIYVRTAYVTEYKALIPERKRSGQAKPIILTGRPGIGKTMFALYAALRFCLGNVKDDKKFSLILRLDESSFVFVSNRSREDAIDGFPFTANEIDFPWLKKSFGMRRRWILNH